MLGRKDTRQVAVLWRQLGQVVTIGAEFGEAAWRGGEARPGQVRRVWKQAQETLRGGLPGATATASQEAAREELHLHGQ